MSGDVTYQALDRLTYLPSRDALKNGNCIAGQSYYDVFFSGGTIGGINFDGFTSANQWMNAILPAQSGKSNNILTTNGSSANWSSTINVTSIGATTPGTGAFTDFNLSGNFSATTVNKTFAWAITTGTDLMTWQMNADIIRWQFGSNVYSIDLNGFNGVIGGTTPKLATFSGMTVGTAAIATTATAGFPWIPSCAGAPTGVPTPPYTNAAALVVDTTDSKLYVRVGTTWKSVTLA